MFALVTTTQQLSVAAELPIVGVGAAAGDWPSRITATVPEEDSDMTVRSVEVAVQLVLLLQMVNITGSTTAPKLLVAVTWPRRSKRIVIGYESPTSETKICVCDRCVKSTTLVSFARRTLSSSKSICAVKDDGPVKTRLA